MLMFCVRRPVLNIYGRRPRCQHLLTVMVLCVVFHYKIYREISERYDNRK